MALSKIGPPLRVLLVPDTTYWVCGTIAKELALHNPSIEATICSGNALRTLPDISQYAGLFDLVHFLTPHEATANLSGFLGRIPIVTTVHHVEDNKSTESIAQSDAVMTVCMQWHNYLISHGLQKNKAVMVPNGINSDIFFPPSAEEKALLKREYEFPEDSLIVGFIAKKSSDTHHRKGTDVFIRAISDLSKLVTELHVLIVGPGWEDFVAELRNECTNCTWIPFILEQEEFARIYRCMDAYWCTAKIEGGPVPILEAMSSGVCCLSTPVGMVPDLIVSGENGVIVSYEDSLAFAKETASLFTDPQRMAQMGQAARKTAINERRWEDTAKQVIPLYDVAISNFENRTDRGIESHPLPSRSKGSPAWPKALLKAREELFFMNFLGEAGQDRAARKAALHAIRIYPGSADIWWKAAPILHFTWVAKSIAFMLWKYDGFKKRVMRMGGRDHKML